MVANAQKDHMKCTYIRNKALGLFLGLLACQTQAQVSAPINAQFEYDLKITADPAKRAAYLKQSGEALSHYEQVFNLVKGSIQVATAVDKVDIRKDQYHINSTGTLALVLSAVLNDQKLFAIRSYLRKHWLDSIMRS